MLGTAIKAISLKRVHENTALFSSHLILLSLKNTNMTDNMQLTPWHINVAHATPATPMPKVLTNKISTAILEVDEAARNQNGVFESPSAENIPVDIL